MSPTEDYKAKLLYLLHRRRRGTLAEDEEAELATERLAIWEELPEPEQHYLEQWIQEALAEFNEDIARDARQASRVAEREVLARREDVNETAHRVAQTVSHEEAPLQRYTMSLAIASEQPINIYVMGCSYADARDRLADALERLVNGGT